MPTRRDFLLVEMAAGMAVAATLGCVAFIESFRGGKELTMNPSDGAGADLVTLPERAHRTETVERLSRRCVRKRSRCSPTLITPRAQRRWGGRSDRHAC